MVPTLIARQLDVVLSLVDKKGHPSKGRLYVRVTQGSTLVVAGDAIEQAGLPVKKLSPPIIPDASDAFTNISNTLSDQQKLITSFNALMKNFKVFVKIVDEVAKVRSSLSFLSLNNHDFFKRFIRMLILRGKHFLRE